MSDIYKKFDHVFSRLEEFLSHYSKSQFLHGFILNLYLSFIYGNIINNFFSNLNQLSIEKLNLPKGQIGKIRKKYKEIQKEAKLAIARSLKGKTIDKKYYNNFKSLIKNDFPEFLKIIIVIEKEINISKLNEFISKKKTEIKALGKDENDFDAFLTTKPLEAYIKAKKEIPSEKNFLKLIKSINKDILPKFSKEVSKSLIEDKYSLLSKQRKLRKDFEINLYEKWKDSLDLLECFIYISLEIGEKCKEKLDSRINNTNKNKFDALVLIHARSLNISDEIYNLLKSGFADGAIARWRSLHELAVISMFLNQNNNEVSQRYLEHAVIRNYKEAKDYRRFYKKLGYLPIERKEFNTLEKEKIKLCTKYKDKFQKDYGWIPSSIIKANNIKTRDFRSLEQLVKLDKLRPYYNIACDSHHGGSKGFNRQSLHENYQNKRLLAGPTNYGLADPIQLTATSLKHIDICLLTLESDLECILQIYVINNFVEEIHDKTEKAQRKLEKVWA